MHGRLRRARRYRPRAPAVHFLRSARRCPVTLPAGEHYGWCACGQLKTGTPDELDRWWARHVSGIDLATYEAGMRALHGRSRSHRWGQTARELGVLAHAALVLREPARWHPLASARTWLARGRHAILLTVDVLPAAARAPTERTVVRPEVVDGSWRSGEPVRVLRRWRNGRWGWLDVEADRWYPNVAVAGATAITANTGSNNWNTNGAWVGSVQPTAADDVTIPASAVVTIPSATTALCRSISVSASGTIAFAATTSLLNVGDGSGGAATFDAACTVTLTAVGTITLLSTSNNGGTGWGVTTGGKVMPNLTFNATGGKWVLQDAVTCSAFTPATGTIDTNSKSILCTQFSNGGNNTRTLTLGSSAITCTLASSNISANFRFSGLTMTANTATFTINGAGGGFQVANNAGNFNGTSIVLSGSGAMAMNWIVGCTVANLTRTGTAATTDSLTISNNFTWTGTLTLGGNTTQGINRVLVTSDVVGTQRTITGTGAAVVISGDVDFRDIDITGSPSWTNSGSKFVGDCGGNGSLITTNMTTAATQTATGTASITWSTHGWTTRVPLPQDNVVINNAFIAGRVVNADMPRVGKSIDFTGGSGSPQLNFPSSQAIFGSLTLVTGVTIQAQSGTVTFAGRSAYTLTMAGASFGQPVALNAPSGSLTLQDAFTNTRSGTALTITLGTFVDGGKVVTLSGASGAFVMTGGTLTKTGAWAFSTTGAVSFVSVTGGTITDSGSWTLTATSANTRTFAGGGATYGTLTYTVPGSTGQLNITGSNPFAGINFSDVTNARTLAFTAGTTTTITTANGFNVQGTAGKLMSVDTITAATHTLTSAFSQSVRYVSVKNSTVDAGRWVDFDGTDVSGNTNWLFNIVPVAFILGTGSVAAPALAPVPTTISGTGTVQSPTVDTGSSGATATPSVVTGTGTVQSPLELAVIALANIAGTGTVQVPTELAAAKPSNIAGIGTMQTPTEIALALPAYVPATGTVQTPLELAVSALAAVLGIGTVESPTVLVAPLPGVLAGIGSVFTATQPTSTLPGFVAGIGIAYTPLGAVVALPGALAGVGTVQAPAAVDSSTPLVVAGVGTVQSPLELVVTLPSNIAGVGTVQVPAVLTGIVPTPAVVAGVGTVQTPLELLAALPVVIAGVGVVQTPLQLEPAFPLFIAGTGAVLSITVALYPVPVPMIGVGTVFSPVVLVTSIAVIYLCGSITINITKRSVTSNICEALKIEENV